MWHVAAHEIGHAIYGIPLDPLLLALQLSSLLAIPLSLQMEVLKPGSIGPFHLPG